MRHRTSTPESRLHVAIIMDGNGRWAEARGWPRLAGHRAGGEAVQRIVEAAPDVGVGTLTLFAFSADNWGRPRPEVGGLMRLFGEYLRNEVRRCRREGVRLSFIGRRDRLSDRLTRAMRAAETATEAGTRLHLRLAVDYSARERIVAAAQRVPSGTPLDHEAFFKLLGEIEAPGAAAPPVDLLIRTGGEQRLSDFLLWEAAYAELYFTAIRWPDFTAKDLEAAVREFHGRQRRFGLLPKRAAS